MIHPVDQKLTTGQRAADWLANTTGSWSFLIVHSILIGAWVFANVSWMFHPHWDVYPFILLNLILSLEAAYTNPVILMAQKRQNDRDRDLAAWDHIIQVRVLGILEKMNDVRPVQNADGETLQQDAAV